MIIVDDEEYKYFIDELMENPNQPYRMANEELATALFDRMLEDDTFREATMHNYFITQYICINNTARHALLRIINEQKKQQIERLQATDKLISEIKERADNGNNCNH